MLVTTPASIIVPNSRDVPIHRCILTLRSLFFKNLFGNCGKKEKRLIFELKDLARDFKVGYDYLVLVLGYLYTGKVKALPRNVCVDEECDHLGCKPAVDSMVEVLYASFVFQIPELVALYQLKMISPS